MSSADAAAPAVEGAHTVFIVTNFWETLSEAVEVSQGKAVADASKAAGVKHIIFSSAINVSEASDGRLVHLRHFDGKAEVERYIRQSGVYSTFIQPGVFMSGFYSAFFRKQEDGGFRWDMPEGVKLHEAQLPLIDAAVDTGIFVKAALKLSSGADGKVILAATDYYTPARIIAEFAEVYGQTVSYVEVPHETYKSFLPPPAAQELLETMLLLQDPGYYAGADMKPSLELLGADAPTTWKAFVERNRAKWE